LFRRIDSGGGEPNLLALKEVIVRCWETQLEAGGNATPSTYEMGGKQYVVIAAGGGFGNRASDRRDTLAGDAFVAYALP
jgi:glucose dehydrogenase